MDQPTPTPEEPVKKPNRAYSSALMIRMTPAQNELLHKLAADASMNVSTYVRVKLKLQKA